MAKNKAVFDADILINMVKTGSLEYLTRIFDQIYISDFVWMQEIRKGTKEYREINKLVNKGFIVILEYNKLTDTQKGFYHNAYTILKNRAPSDFVNEGERITAAFAKAYSVPYYMSDDNKAASFIKSLSAVEVVNYCDLLYIAYVVRPEDIKLLSDFYSKYLCVFEDGYPRTVKGKSGKELDFIGIIAKCYDKFEKSQGLSSLLKLLTDKP